MKHRKPISAASHAQRKAVAGKPCLVCGATPTDPAHAWPRGRGGCSSPLCVLPCCRKCHRAFDERRLSLLEYVYPRFIPQLQHMLEHTDPVSMVERLAGDRVVWRSAVAA